MSLLEVGQRFEQIYTQRGFNAFQLAKATGLSDALISELRRGLHQPKPETLEKLASKLDVSPQTILNTGEPLPQLESFLKDFYDITRHRLRQCPETRQAYLEELKTRFLDICKARAVGPYELAQMAGISYTAIQSLQKAESFPEKETVQKVCRALNVSEELLLNPQLPLPKLRPIRLTPWRKYAMFCKKSEENEKAYLSKLSARFRRLIEGHSLYEISKATGLQIRTLSNLAKGLAYPEKTTVEKIVRFLNISEKEFLNVDADLPSGEIGPPIPLWKRKKMLIRQSQTAKIECLGPISQRFRIAYTVKGFSQESLAQATGVSKATVQTFAAGKFLPTQTNLNKLLKPLGITEIQLLDTAVPINQTPDSFEGKWKTLEQRMNASKSVRKACLAKFSEKLKALCETESLTAYRLA